MGGACRGASLCCTILLGCALLSCSALPARHSGIQGLRGGGWKAPQFGVSRKHGLGKVSAPPGEAATAAGQKVTRRGSLAGVTVVAMIYFLSVALAIPALPKLVNTVVGDSQGRASGSSRILPAFLHCTCFSTLREPPLHWWKMRRIVGEVVEGLLQHLDDGNRMPPDRYRCEYSVVGCLPFERFAVFSVPRAPSPPVE
jgi:hypothetical protein